MARTIVWEIADLGGDSYYLTRERRPVANDISLDLAKDMIRRRFTPDDRVVMVDVDGYQTDVTKDFKAHSKKVSANRNNPLTPPAVRSTMTDMTTTQHLSGKPSGFAVDGTWATWNQSTSRPSSEVAEG